MLIKKGNVLSINIVFFLFYVLKIPIIILNNYIKNNLYYIKINKIQPL